MDDVLPAQGGWTDAACVMLSVQQCEGDKHAYTCKSFVMDFIPLRFSTCGSFVRDSEGLLSLI